MGGILSNGNGLDASTHEPVSIMNFACHERVLNMNCIYPYKGPWKKNVAGKRYLKQFERFGNHCIS